MIIAALKSSEPSDKRSPIHIETIQSLVSLNTTILFEKGIGDGIYTNDSQFESNGLKSETREACLSQADLIITLQPLTEEDLSKVKTGPQFLGWLIRLTVKNISINARKKV